MRFIYSLALFGYRVLLQVVAPWHHKANKWVNGQKNIFGELKDKVKIIEKPIIWIHCASLGEFEQARPLIELLKKDYQNYKLLITFFSPSGYEHRKDYPGIITSYLPLDSEANAKTFLEIVHPEVALFVKYEFWFHYFNQCKKTEIPLLSVSARFYPSQYYFKKAGFFGRKILRLVDQFYVQDQLSKDLLLSVSIKNCLVTGDTRFDQVKQLRQNHTPLPKIGDFKDEKPLIVLGSVWPDDLAVIAGGLNDYLENDVIKLIVAPHEINPEHLKQIESYFKKSIQRYSSITSTTDKEILLIDNVGMLASIYHYADIAYVGGGFGTGLHNILEAATYGIPVIYGNKTSKFREAADLENFGGGKQISDENGASHLFEKLIYDETLRSNMGHNAGNFIDHNAGASEKILEHMSKNKFIKP